MLGSREEELLRVYREQGEQRRHSQVTKDPGPLWLILGVITGTLMRIGYEVFYNGRSFNLVSVMSAVLMAVVALGLWQKLVEHFEETSPALKFFIGISIGFGSQSIT